MTVPPVLGPGEAPAGASSSAMPAVRPPLGPGDADPRSSVREMAAVLGPLDPGASPAGAVHAPAMTVPPALKPGDLVGPEPDEESVVFPAATPGGSMHFGKPVRRPKR